MRWDEEAYGREYDLDVFNIVAVDDFNMGAMENKSLNIFNTSCVLCSPEITTDGGFQRVQAIIAHEYAHHIQAELWRQSQDEGKYVPWPKEQNVELVADCLSGAFMAVFDQVEELAEDDVAGIIDGLILMGDGDPDLDDHGTALERAVAFVNGYASPDGVNRCMTAYWPGFADDYTLP